MATSSGETGETRNGRIGIGTVLRHRDGDAVVIQRRKDDNSGWWLYGMGGLDDRALTSGDWFYVAPSVTDLVTRFDRAVLADIEARNPGIDLDEVTAHRNAAARIGGSADG